MSPSTAAVKRWFLRMWRILKNEHYSDEEVRYGQRAFEGEEKLLWLSFMYDTGRISGAQAERIYHQTLNELMAEAIESRLGVRVGT